MHALWSHIATMSANHLFLDTDEDEIPEVDLGSEESLLSSEEKEMGANNSSASGDDTGVGACGQLKFK